MKRLIIDVSTHLMYIGFAKDGLITDFSVRLAKKDHAKYLVDRIDQVLKRNQTTLDTLDEIIIGIGPGSYTGLRVGLTVAKMFAYTKNISLRQVSSLFLLTSGYQQKIAAMMDARRGNVFGAIYQNGKVLVADQHHSLAAFLANEAHQDAKQVLIDETNFKVDLTNILKQAVLVTDVHALIPNYLRQTEAEANYAKKNGN